VVLNLITEKKMLTLVNISLKRGVGNGKVTYRSTIISLILPQGGMERGCRLTAGRIAEHEPYEAHTRKRRILWPE
jgi:hypothetical protein